MQDADSGKVTLYLQKMQTGDDEAIDLLLPHIYSDLKRLAQAALKQQWRSHTLQPTALVHEAYLRLVHPDGRGFESRRHFLAVASMAMRQLLQDYARVRNAEKRTGGRERLELESLDMASPETEVDLVGLHEALSALEVLDERQARIVELRFLTGLSVEETARILGVSERTVYHDWNMARAWLERRLSES